MSEGRNDSGVGTFYLKKSSPIGKRTFFCQFSLQKALERYGVSSSAELDQQALPAGHLQPFAKGWRKLLIYFTSVWIAAA